MTPELMRAFQTDPRTEILPFVFTARGGAAIAGRVAGTWTAVDDTALTFLEKWNGEFTPDAGGAVLFDAFLAALSRRTWDELVLPGENRRVAVPSQMMLVRLFGEPTSVWWDDLGTEAREQSHHIVQGALRDAWTATKTRFGRSERRRRPTPS